MFRRRGVKKWLGIAAVLLVGALFKNQILGLWKKIPVVGTFDLESKIGDNA